MLNDLQKDTGVKVIVVGAVANLVLAVLKIAGESSDAAPPWSPTAFIPCRIC